MLLLKDNRLYNSNLYARSFWTILWRWSVKTKTTTSVNIMGTNNKNKNIYNNNNNVAVVCSSEDIDDDNRIRNDDVRWVCRRDYKAIPRQTLTRARPFAPRLQMLLTLPLRKLGGDHLIFSCLQLVQCRVELHQFLKIILRPWTAKEYLCRKPIGLIISFVVLIEGE